MTQYEAWYDTEKKWVSFYPLDQLDESDDRSSEELFKQSRIYGKALIGVCGYQPVWMHHYFEMHQIRLKK